MGLFDDAVGKVGDVADKASGLLDAAGGGAKTGEAEGKAEFVKDENLSDLETKQTISVAPAAPGSEGASKPNALNDSLLEFIHFGQVHADSGNKFAHPKFDPATEKSPPDGHGMMMRDAVEREAVLLFGFVSSTKVAVQDTTKNRGAIEDLGAMAGNLLGGSNTTSKPDPNQLNKFTDAIKEQIGIINKLEIQYPEIHEAGKKLHETRANYQAFCKTLDDYYLQPPKSEGLGAISDAIGSAAANIPGVGKIIGVVQRIAFKMLDMYLAAYLELRKDHEHNIELAVHKLTIQAIKGNYAKHLPVYPIWFKKPKDEKADEKKDEKYADKAPDFLKPLAGKADDAKEKAGKITDDIYEFAGGKSKPEPTPGSDIIGAIFTKLAGGANKESTEDAPPTGSESIVKGLDATLSDIGGVPNFMKRVIAEVNQANLGLLEEVFRRLMAKEASAEIDARLLLESGRAHLTHKFTTLFTKLIMGMIGDSVPTPDMDVQGQKLTGEKSEDDYALNVGGKKLSAKELLAKQLDEKLGKYVEPIIQQTIGDLAGQLEASRKKAETEKAQTMEVFLGRLPWLTAMMFRNTFFPMWNLVAEEVFGSVAAPLKSALQAINGGINKAKDNVDKVAEYNRRAKKLGDDATKLKDDSQKKLGTGDEERQNVKQLGTDVNQGMADGYLETAEGKKRREEREAANKQKQALDDFYQENDKDKEFPITARIVEGQGKKVQEEVESVLEAPKPATATA